MAGGFGGGGAWTKDQEDIYWHAKGLGISDVPHPYGPDMEQNTADDLTKSQWRDFTERLNAAKEKATAGGTRDFVLGATDAQKKRSSDWYKTPEGADYAESLGLSSGFGIRDGGDGGGGGSSAPYASNPFFPQLVQDYTPPGLLNWSGYMPAGGLFGHEQYQPWTNPNNIPSNIFNYQPPRIHAGGYGSTGGYPIGSYPTGGYPTGGYPTGGYPTGGYSTGGYPTGTAPTGTIPTGTISTETAPQPDRWVPETPMTMTPFQNSMLGNAMGDQANTLGGLMAIATDTAPFTSVGSDGDYDMQRAADQVREHVIQSLVQETPALQHSVNVLGGDPSVASQRAMGLPDGYSYDHRLEAAQRNIDNAIAAAVKNNPAAAKVAYNAAQFIPVALDYSNTKEGRGGQKDADKSSGKDADKSSGVDSQWGGGVR